MDELTDDYHQERLDHARESHFNRDVQQREIRLQNELQKYKVLMVRCLLGFCQISMGTAISITNSLTSTRTVTPLSWF